MNKIYKVVWSKAKRCYVVTSELAKRNGKGCGTRSLRMAAVSVGVAAALIGGVGFGSPVAEAADPVISGSVTKGGTTKNFTQANFTYESGGTTYQNDYGYANTFFDGESATPPTSAQGYTVNITSAPNWRFFVGAGVPYGTVSGNSVTVNGDSTNITQEVIGGYAYGEETGTKTSTVTNNSVTVNGGTLASVSGANMGGYWAAPGTASDNTVTINAGLIKGDIRGAFGYDKAEKNRVYIKGGTVDFYNDSFSVTGGESGTGTASNNEVIISDGTAGNENGGGIRGGMSWRGQANENKVTISGGTVKGAVYGGMNSTLTGRTIYSGETPEEHTPLTGTVSNNEVQISGGTVNGNVYGGMGAVSASGNTVTIKENAVLGKDVEVYGGTAMAKYSTTTYTYTGSVWEVNTSVDKVEYGTVTGNTINIEDSASVTGEVAGGYGAGGDNQENKVYVKGGTVTGNVYGARINSTESTAGNATANEVHISNGTITGNVFGGSVEGSVAGDVKGNKVEISGGTIQGVDATIYDSRVYGGYSEKGTAGGDAAADGNNVTVTGGTVYGEVWGGYAKEGNAKNNTATMSGGNVEGIVMGGWAYGDATDNTLTVTGGTLRLPAGGYSDHGNANNNTVNFGGTAVSSNYMYGGQTYVGSANDNTVNITGGTVKDNVSGGYADSAGIASGNTVNMSNGTVTGNVRGGQAYEGNADNNTVSVSGTATVGNGNYAYIYGGWTDEKAATGNTVTIGGGKVNGTKGAEIYGGYTNGSGATTNNTVNLTGSTTGLENAEVYGGSQTTYTGNELHVGGTKDGSVTGAWTGSSNNTVNKVSNFETIVYHSVNWSTTVAALEATTVENVGAIDINDLAFDSASATGTMSLLKSGSDLSAIKLKYSGSTTGVYIATGGVEIGGGSSKQIEETGVNGVKLTTQTTGDKVLLASDKKAINYSKGVTTVSAITFGTFDVDADNAARDLTGSSFATVNIVDAAGLTFKDTTDALKKNDSITLVNNATGITTTVANGTGKTIGINYTDDQKIAFTATATGNVTSAGGVVKYTVGSVAVNNIDVTKWNGTPSTVTASWDTKNAEVKTSGISVTGMNPGDTKTILTAASGSDFSSVTLDAGAWQKGGDITDTAVNGVEIAGETTGGGVKVSNDKTQLVYQQDKKNVTGITLGAFDASQAARSFGSGDDLRSATINAGGFSISNLDATKSSVVVLDATNAVANNKGETLQGDTLLKTMDPVEFSDPIDGTVLTFAGKHTDTLEQNAKKTQIVYKVGDKNVNEVKFDGEVAWDDSKAYYENKADANGKFAYTFNGATNVDAENLKVAGTSNTLLKADGSSSMTLLSATGMTAGTFKDQSEANKAASKVSVNYKDGQGVAFKAEAKGAVATEPGAVKYKINEVKLTDVDLSGWTGSESSVPDTWTADDGSVKVAAGSFAEPDVAVGSSRTILTADGAFFDDANISGANKYDEANGKAFSETQNNVTVSGTQAKGVAASEDSKSLVYKVDVKKADTVTLGSMNWQKDATLFDGSSATEYDYANVTAVDAGKFDVTYASPETVAAGESMTLLKANETLTAIINEEKAKAYSFSPVSGVTVDAAITGKLANSGNNVVFTAAANQASKLTFGDVEWKDSGALMARPSNITFAGADVDTSKINFTNMIYLDADRQMTLVSDFGDKVGTITGSKYLVGTAFEGEGAASLSGSDLVFRTKTGAGVSEQTHKTVMATEVGVTMLNTGNDYIDKAMEGMGDLANVAPDGTTVGAAIGGGRNRYETGSHVNVNSWNAAVAVGAKRELKNGSLEYGVFGEYGKANFTLHSDAGKGDGDSHYAGGGLLAKWTNKHDVYTEASFRLGRLNESSNDIMRDGLGNKYGYDVHANYFGAHVGVGKIFRYKGGKSLDVYGKYFYTKRDGVEFDAVQHYKLDSVKSSILRIGARYGTTDKKWNWYGGLAYEYEFDGEATGTVKDTAIRAASIKGSSVRGEIGMRMNATKTNPWQTDISLYGYGGKHRGFGGNVNVAYMF